MTRRGLRTPAAWALGLVLLTTACGSGPATVTTASSTARPARATAVVPASSPAPPTTPTPPSSTPAAVDSTAVVPTAAAPGPVTPAPVIVLDPGHSPTIHSVDPTTGLVDSDYENEPEMTDVFAVAELVRTRLVADGYQVVMTKNSVTDRVSLGQRATVANDAHAALALSIHDQAGAQGGIGFDDGNDIVYSQSVGGYRVNPAGVRTTFTDAAVAATSARYGAVFQAQRTAVEGHSVRLQGDVGYDLGTRGLAPGTMWMVQLLSTVPWIYNEAGGNSAGGVGLDAADRQRYADGLVASVEACVPVG